MSRPVTESSMAVQVTSSPSASQDAFLQARVRLLLDLLLAFGVVFFGFMVAEAAVTGIAEMGVPGFWLLGANTLVVAVGRALVGRTPRTVRFVRAVETGVLVVFCAIVALLMRTAPLGYRPELLLLLVYAVVVFGRAALVPSTTRQTIILCACFSVGVALVSWGTYVGFESPGPAYPKQTSQRVTVFTELWWLVISSVAVAVSRVIYGLRNEVSEARQLGQYTLERKLGEGGMGEVYRARHAMLRRPTAVKLISPEHTSEQALARFEREVQLTAELTHPNTITVFDYGRTEDGVFYYAMELLDGATLSEVVAVDGAQSAGRVTRVLSQVADALGEAHEVGLIHRDIKPANIMLTHQGSDRDAAKVLDFGLVRELRADGDAVLTQEDAIQGTPLYMAPETISKADGAGPRSDIYALGAVGYFLLTGEHVFTGETIVEVCAHHLHTDPVPPSERLGRPVPAHLERIILDCLSKDPDARPGQTKELLARLATCDDTRDWTSDHATQWWKIHGPAIQALREGKEQPGSRTLLAADALER